MLCQLHARKTSLLYATARSFLSALRRGTNHWTALNCTCNLMCNWPSSINLQYRAISYQRALLLFTPYMWLRFGYAASNASDPIRQLVGLAQTFTYFLAIYHVMAELCFRLCYSLRARCCRLYIDFLLSLTPRNPEFKTDRYLPEGFESPKAPEVKRSLPCPRVDDSCSHNHNYGNRNCSHHHHHHDQHRDR